MEATTVSCSTCAAEVSLEANVTAAECPFCGTHVVLEGGSKQLIKPESLLPFKVTKEEATKAFRDWIASLWFAPNNLKDRARDDKGISGVYLPHWTYDADTRTWYRGERGDNYQTTETYTEKDSEGNSQTKTRTVTKIRWHSCSGVVYNKFDDLLVVASHSLPVKYVRELEPWDLENLTPYQDDYLSGFKAESYTVGLKDGFTEAQAQMVPHIESKIKRDIGGDHQRIHRKDIGYHDVSFKHVLLPVWLNAYRYQDKVFRFVVNARTGEVQGERPYSAIKIALAVIAVIILIALIVIGVRANNAKKDGATSMLDEPTAITMMHHPEPTALWGLCPATSDV